MIFRHVVYDAQFFFVTIYKVDKCMMPIVLQICSDFKSRVVYSSLKLQLLTLKSKHTNYFPTIHHSMGWRPLVSIWLFISTVCTVLCHPAESVCPSDTILWCHQPLPTLSSSLCTSLHDPKHHTLRSRLQVVFGMGEPGSRGGIFSWHAQALEKKR